MNRQGKRAIRSAAAMLLLASVALAAGDWVIFKGQVNGPVANPDGIDLASFTPKNYDDIFTTETWYHHMNFPDGSMVTVQVGFNTSDVNVAFVYGKPGAKFFKDFIMVDKEEARFDSTGFGLTIGKNRIQLKDNKYYINLDLPESKVKVVYDIIGPSYTYGDGMVRYPDGDTFMYYSLPITWAKVSVEAAFNGQTVKLSGFGDMNHDAGVMYPGYTPANWQAFWFFGDDHRLSVTDHFTNPKFGGKLTQRLVFVTRDGMFTSTDFPMKWDDWKDSTGIPFRYPRHYTLTAEGGGATLTAEIKMRETVLMEDLFSNLPSALRLVVQYLTRNGWTMDSWSDYTITYTHDGRTETYQGQGIVRWCDLEQEKK